MGKLLKFMPAFLMSMYIIGMLMIIGALVAICAGPTTLNKVWQFVVLGIILTLGTSGFYNDIYKDILKRTNKLYLFPGIRRNRFFVNTVVAVLLLLLAIGSKDTSDTIEGLEFKSKWQTVEIQYLREYHDASETFLNSLGVDCDHPMLESDAGADYLQAKFNLDEYENDR